MLGLRWRFARGRLVVDLAVILVTLVIVLPLLLLESLLFDLVVIDEGSEDSVSVEVGENVFILGFFAFFVLIFSSSSEEGDDDLIVALLLQAVEVVPKDGARLTACRFTGCPQYESERLTR
jgi:hypothetical protein